MENNKNNLITRPPVVTILGHVDHGKSSILEAIKNLKITAKESGGITQHIAAYEIEHESKKITFVDTPGHEAFSAMRSRGAKLADIAVLVIAAEEGIKPQTKEAIKHIKERGIPMIVALNKADKPEANPERVKRELMSEEIVVESFGGKVPSVNVSATTGKGIPELLELILLLAEVEEYQADLSLRATGYIVESHLDPNRGATATMIIKNGTLNKGDVIGTSSAVGKVKNMEDFQGNSLEEAIPSMPVIILGFESVPNVGEGVKVFSDTEEAKEQSSKSLGIFQEESLATDKEEVLKLIIKADVRGSLEAIKEVLKTIPQEKARIQVLRAEVGEINESDVKLAETSEAMIVGFRVKANSIAKKLALRDKIRLVTFDVIYHLGEAVRTALEKKVSHELVRKNQGKFKVLTIFKADKNGQILGGKVLSGEIKKSALLDIYRDEEKVGKGKIIKLQREKKEVGEVVKGYECGMLYRGEVEVQEDDILEAYTEETYRPGLD